MVFFKMALSNLAKKKGRTALTILAITLSGALLTGITILSNSYTKSYEKGVSRMLGNTDIGVGLNRSINDGFFTLDDVTNNGEFNISDLDGYIAHTSRIMFYFDFTNFENTVQQHAFSTTFIGIDPALDKGFGYTEFYEIADDIGDPEDIMYTNKVI